MAGDWICGRRGVVPGASCPQILNSPPNASPKIWTPRCAPSRPAGQSGVEAVLLGSSPERTYTGAMGEMSFPPEIRQWIAARLAEGGYADEAAYILDLIRRDMAEVLDIERHSFESKAKARMAVFTWIEGWYNPRRRHSGLGYLSPLNFERSQQTRFNAPEHDPQHADGTPQMV